jgi:Dcp1-like decapping family
MTPASRYDHNLKVLRRRDPSIVSIFDQFSHVCVYHHNGKKWEKHGFEGSMFLYERYVERISTFNSHWKVLFYLPRDHV